MQATVVRYTTRPDRAEENQGLVERVFAELAATRPEGLRYVTFRLEDGVSFVHVATVAGADNPLSSTDAFARFQAEIGDRLVAGPLVTGATVVGSYGFGLDRG